MAAVVRAKTSADVLFAALMDAPNAQWVTTLKTNNALKIRVQVISLGALAALILASVIYVISNMASWNPTLMDSASALLANGSAKTKRSAQTVIR
jgi:hypothetical protein